MKSLIHVVEPYWDFIYLFFIIQFFFFFFLSSSLETMVWDLYAFLRKGKETMAYYFQRNHGTILWC